MIDLNSEIKNYLIICKKQRRLSKHTVKAYEIDLRQFYGFKVDMSLEKADLVHYIQHLHEIYKPKSAKRKIASLKAFIRYLYYNDIICTNPLDKIDISFKEPMVLPRTIPEGLLNGLFVCAYNDIRDADTDYKYKAALCKCAVLELLFATGARISEICSLKLDAVDLLNHTVRILGKGSRERIIEIENPEVISILKKYRDEVLEGVKLNEYFFINSRKNRLSEQSVRNMITTMENRINSQIHITPHMFRHSLATLLLEENVDIRYIQRILGHSSITTTQIYTHVASAKQKEILRSKHPRNKMDIYIDCHLI